MSYADEYTGLDYYDDDDHDTPDLPEWASMGVCPEVHADGTRCVRVATRWQTHCAGCDEPIRPGAVGLATWDDERRCDAGGINHQHGCGVWNTPTEVTVGWDVEAETLADAVQRALIDLRDEVAREKAACWRELDRLAREELAATVRALARGELSVADLQSAESDEPGVGYDWYEHALVAAYPLTHDEWVTRTVPLPGTRESAGWQPRIV